MEDISQDLDNSVAETQSTDTPPAPKKRAFKSKNPDLAMRPAKSSELPMIHERIGEAVDTTSEYTDRFRAYEKARLNLNYLRNLHAIDPHHIFILENKGQTIGFMLSGPEFGTLWLYWSYIFPEFRRASLAMSFLPMFNEYWDNGRFHKIATYTLPENKIAVALMKRFKYELRCVLPQHLFGQDFNLFEYPLNKVEEGYDNGMNIGMRGRFMARLKSLFGG